MPRQTSRARLILVSLAAAAFLAGPPAGCGGGGGGGAPSGPTGRVAVTVDWPARGRYVPPYANSVRARITVGTKVFTLVMNRAGDQAQQATSQFSSAIPVGDHTMQVEAFTGVNAGGSLVAQAAVGISVVEGQTTSVNVSADLQSTIDHVEIEGEPLRVPVGLQAQLSARAVSSTGGTILLPPGALVWSIESGGEFGDITTTGLFTAMAEGDVVVKVQEPNIAISDTATVEVFEISGSLPPNKIFYSVGTGSGLDGFYISPDGSGNTAWFSVPFNIAAAALNPAGDKWAFFYSSDPFGNDPRWDLYTNTTLTISGATRLTNNDYVFAGTVQFTGDGGTIVFTAQGFAESDPRLRRIPAGGGTITDIYNNAEEAQLNPLTNKIVFTRLTSGAGDIWTINLDGSSPTPLVQNAAEDWMPQWSKDGGTVVFSTNRHGTLNFEIYTVASNGTGLTRRTNTPQFAEFGPSMSPDGSQIAFTVVGGDPPDVDQFGLYRMNLDGSSRTPLVLNSGILLSAYWSSTTGLRPSASASNWGVAFRQGPSFRRRFDR